MAETEPLVNGNSNGAHESQYIKELQKTIRNVNKKLSLMVKVDSIISDNPNMSLDELVSARKINADQKAQALKKPSLQAQLAQLEDQITQYRKFEDEFTQRHKADKDQLISAHQKELQELRGQIKPLELVAEPAKAAEQTPQVPLRESLLSLSRFLRAAAARRMLEDDGGEETQAFEGALLLLYGGDETAVDAMEKLIEGADEGVTSTEGVVLNVTYSTIKKMSLEAAGISDEQPTLETVEDVQPDTQAEAAASEPASASTPVPAADTTTLTSDPTLAHAGLTEQSDVAAPLPNGHSEEPQHNIEAGSIDAGAANDVAATSWDALGAAAGSTASASADPSSENVVSIPRDLAETDNVTTAAAVNATASWADDATATPAPAAAAAPASVPAPAPVEAQAGGKAGPVVGEDGFHEVQRRNNGRSGRGGHEGGRGGGGRGRGFRGGRGRGGDGRGRGRGRGDAAAAAS